MKEDKSKEERLKKFISEYPKSSIARSLSVLKVKEHKRFLRKKRKMEKLAKILSIRDKYKGSLIKTAEKLGLSKQRISFFLKDYPYKE